MNSLMDEIRALLRGQGCTIVGFADLKSLSKEARQNFDYGIVIGLSYTRKAMEDNKNGLPAAYYAEFTPINKKLPLLANMTAQYLTDRCYKALAKVSSMVVQDEDYRTVLPHKTVATLAGIGWIGKCATLVTTEVGSALRLTVVLTDAALECGFPVTESLCPDDCTVCADVCPGHAPLGGKWRAGVDRDVFFNAHACRPAARAHAKAALGIDETLCALCISNCPFTMKALGYT
jgi:epoxyqueuosine reductase QueG